LSEDHPKTKQKMVLSLMKPRSNGIPECRWFGNILVVLGGLQRMAELGVVCQAIKIN
jgi:hypothetical protein